MILELNDDEAGKLLTMIDEAVKTHGLKFAHVAVELFNKIKQAQDAEQTLLNDIKKGAENA